MFLVLHFDPTHRRAGPIRQAQLAGVFEDHRPVALKMLHVFNAGRLPAKELEQFPFSLSERPGAIILAIEL